MTLQQKKRRIDGAKDGSSAVVTVDHFADDAAMTPVKTLSLEKYGKTAHSVKKTPRVVFSANNGDVKEATVTLLDNYSHTAADDDGSLESDEEGEINRAGNVPLHWYNDLGHVGYDAFGGKISKVLDVSEVTRLLKEADDPDSWRTIVDVRNQTTYRLSDTDLEIIRRLKAGKFPVPAFDMCGPESVVEFDNPEEAVHPSNSAHPPKRRFLPSLWENKRINKLVKLIRRGIIRAAPPEAPEVFDLWGPSICTIAEDEARGRVRGPPPLSAPKLKLPDHSESYNPAEEFLLTEEERQAWYKAHPDDREMNYLPKKYACLRHVPGYPQNLLERFQRCLDLYLCPRATKMRMNVDPSSLLPQLPSLADLRPFPTRLAMTFETDASKSAPVSLAFDGTGTYLAIGRKNGRLEVFDVATSRLVFAWDVPCATVSSDSDASSPSMIGAVQFNPVYPLIAVAKGSSLHVVCLPLIAFSSFSGGDDTPVLWDQAAGFQALKLDETPGLGWSRLDNGDCHGWTIEHNARVTHVSWHARGLYCVSVCRHAASPSQQLGIHSLGKLKTLRPFRTNPAGKIQIAHFHPLKNYLYVGCFKGVRLYNLQKVTPGSQSGVGNLVKKFSGVDHVVSVDIHPSGDLIAVGGENRRLTWFDYDLGEKPYKILRYHQDTVRTVGFHKKYPLMYSGSDDGSVHVFHAKVATDLLTPPALIPVKKLLPSTSLNTAEDAELSAIRSCAWHPTQPWVVVGLASGNTGLFV